MHQSRLVFLGWKIFLNVVSVISWSAACDFFWISSIISKRRPFNFIFIRVNSPKSQGAKSIPHPPYSPDLASSDFGLFPFENEVEGPPFWDNQRDSALQAVTETTLRKNFPSSGKRGGTGALQRTGTTWRVMVIFGLNFGLGVFYGGRLETFWSHLINFFCFSHICSSGSSAPSSNLPSLSMESASTAWGPNFLSTALTAWFHSCSRHCPGPQFPF